ncbi:MAG: hypothetical protein AAGE76_08905 [Pseudomonadota bacterium]
MKRTLAAVAVLASAAAFTTPAVAMDQELTMLELAVNNALERIGVLDVDVAALSISQIALINNVLNSDDSQNEKARRVEVIVAR